jgi:asparagine synthase (glutamine-hydrolysing)
MCGIAGVWHADRSRAVDPAILQAMDAALAHRGPDGAGIHVRDGFGFAHRRLSIVDLAAGQQPMATADGALVVVFNGEI